uniref:Ribosomal protein L16 n=2 Tax=Gracilaria tenuistipitata TaxID=2510778 RepID=A0A2S1PUR1_GRATE|nr:ribosomal protein L16 [Gracilaria tenuistipitata]ARU07659.1 ribosomal protein L16 [Gracilaria tenuistipitata]AWH62567.1 ribosomal protein L16 [Gracilaria tenuistipitata]AWH62592.1 ribosomal protein L16 [Gracilaria tenuistipitata var. liui]AXI97769.1 ribosomal protein L16 [Gracilaria tenuistipitata]
MFKEKKTQNKYPLKFKQSNHILKYGRFGIKSMSFSRLTENQLNALKWVLLKKLKQLTNNKKSYRFWTLLSMNFVLTKLNLESRMGKGKGSIYTHAIYVRPGMILFEFDNVTEQQMKILFNYILKKISLKVTLIKSFS